MPVPVVMTQHMPPTFTADPGRRISPSSAACPAPRPPTATTLAAGRIYLAPGNRHLLVEAGPAAGLRARLSDAPAENFCRPSVDPMLRSAAAACEGACWSPCSPAWATTAWPARARWSTAGGTAVAQDEATSVVWGMPGAIAQAGLCHAVLPLPRLRRELLELLRSGRP